MPIEENVLLVVTQKWLKKTVLHILPSYHDNQQSERLQLTKTVMIIRQMAPCCHPLCTMLQDSQYPPKPSLACQVSEQENPLAKGIIPSLPHNMSHTHTHTHHFHFKLSLTCAFLATFNAEDTALQMTLLYFLSDDPKVQ